MDSTMEGKSAQKPDRKMNVAQYDRVARGANAPMYAYYAKKIKDETRIVSGRCLDAGCGGGYLGLALAAVTELDVTFLDISSEMLERARVHITEDGLQGRARTLLADVHDIPLSDRTFDLVISRGSVPFWEDPGKALWQIHRLLAPGGKAFVGGGKGTPEMRERFEREMGAAGLPAGPGGRRHGEDPWKRMKHRDYGRILNAIGIHTFTVREEEDGRWIRMWK